MVVLSNRLCTAEKFLEVKIMFKVERIDHLGIAVTNIDDAMSFWGGALGMELDFKETVEEQKVTTGFVPCENSWVELLESTTPDGPVGKFIEKNGEGLQHVAFKVDNIDQALADLDAAGVRLLDKVARKGAGGARIAFLHPKASRGVLLELCEHE